MGDTTEPVVFNLGDSGEQASNDPRWLAEQMRKQIAAQGTATDNLAGADQFGLADLNQAQLKDKIKELRGEGVEVDTKGVKKVGELRARIAAAMMARDAGTDGDDEDVEDDDEES